jgi:hypothetical protein
VYNLNKNANTIIKETICDFDSVVLWDGMLIYSIVESLKISMDILNQSGVQIGKIKLSNSIFYEELFKLIKVKDKHLQD